MLFTIPSTEHRDRFQESVRKHFPGGKYIVDRLDTEPWHVIVVESCDDPNWLLDMALAAYPYAEVPTYTDWDPQRVRMVQVYVMPEFVKDLAFYWTDEDRFELNEELDFNTYPTFPDAEQLDMLLVEFLCTGTAQEAQDNEDLGLGAEPTDTLAHRRVVTELVEAVGAPKVVERVQSLIREQKITPEQLVDALAAWHAALLVPEPTSSDADS